MNFAEALQTLKPVRSSYPLVRIGGDQDGAYLLPDDLKGIEACFSPGVAYKKSFEDDLSINYKIPCHMCDLSTDSDLFCSTLIEGRQSFEQKWLGTKDNETTLTLESWIESKSPGNIWGDFILQMDIEGNEYNVLQNASSELISRFRIIAIELHYLEVFEDNRRIIHLLGNLAARSVIPLYQKIGSSIPPGYMKRALKLDETGLAFAPYLLPNILHKISRTHSCVHAHPNNTQGDFIESSTGMNIPRVLEITFLRKDRLNESSENSWKPELPHRLDVTNDHNAPPIYLNKNWLNN